MKKLFTIMFFLSLMTISLIQAQGIITLKDKVYAGAMYIDGTIANGKLTQVDKNFKQSMLFQKAGAWTKAHFNFGGNFIKYTENKSIEIHSEFNGDIDFTLLLEFKDGVFKYSYPDTNCSQEMIKNYLKPTIESLAKYLKEGK